MKSLQNVVVSTLGIYADSESYMTHKVLECALGLVQGENLGKEVGCFRQVESQ